MKENARATINCKKSEIKTAWDNLKKFGKLLVKKIKSKTRNI